MCTAYSAMEVMLHRQRIVAPIFQLYSVPGRCAKNHKKFNLSSSAVFMHCNGNRSSKALIGVHFKLHFVVLLGYI